MSKPAPVVLVHGYRDDYRKMRRIAALLEGRGRRVVMPSLFESSGHTPLEILAQHLKDDIEETLGTDARFDLAGFSMGGLVARYYLQRLGGAARIRRFVTISAPHRGTWLAWMNQGHGAVQMRPGSAFLAALNADVSCLRSVEFHSVWTPLDLMILPASSSCLGVGHEHRRWVIAHPLMVIQRSSARFIADLLTAETGSVKDL